MTDIVQFYPNMLKTYQECPKKFEYKFIEKITLPIPMSYFEKGKKIHALANYYLKGQDISKLENALNFSEKEIFEKLKQNKYFQKTYVNSEYNISAKIGDYWIAGRLDAFMKDFNDAYCILDYKTGSIPKNPKYDFQTMFYLLMADKILHGKYSSLSFVYIDLKNDKNIEIELSEELKLEYENLIVPLCRTLSAKSTSFNPKKSETCAFCEYSRLCQI